MYQVPQHIDNNKIFVVKRSEIEGRLDPHYNTPEYTELYCLLASLTCKLSSLKEESYAIFSGITPKSGGDAYTTEPNAVPFIRSGDFTDTNQIDFSNLLYLKQEVHNGIMAASQLKKNDILMAIVGATIGKIGVYLYDREANINQAICGVRLKDSISPFFVQAFYQTSIGQKILERTKRPVARANLNLEEIGRLPIPLVNDAIQCQVVERLQKGIELKKQKESEAQLLLDSIDSYILNELGITLPQITKNLRSRIFLSSFEAFVGNRFDPYYHNAYFEKAFKQLKESSNYKLVRLSDISTLITSGITPKSGGEDYTDSEQGIAFIRSGNIDIMGEVDFDNLLYIKKEIHNTRMKSSKVREGDIMIAIVGATIGQVGIYHSSREANINQAIALVRLKEGYNSEYVKEVIKSSIGQLNLDRLKRPVARANINLEEISSMLIPVPDIKIQNEIVKSIVSIRQQAKQEIERIILG